MKELFRGESTKSLKAAVLKCPIAELYLYLLPEGQGGETCEPQTRHCSFECREAFERNMFSLCFIVLQIIKALHVPKHVVTSEVMPKENQDSKYPQT
jgi:hypothetical protein